MSTTYAVTVTIGRNVPQSQVDAALREGLVVQVPGSVDGWSHYQLTPQAWQAYTEQVEEALETYVDEIETTSWWTETHDGVGEWDGVFEESRKITLLFGTPNGLPLSAREELVLELLSTRTGFYQDAVALSFGESVLV